MTSIDPAAPRESPANLLLAAGIVAIGILLCIPSIREFSFVWRDSQFYGHAYALPIVAGYLVYSDRRKIARVLRRLQPPVYGAWVVLGAGMFEVLMYMGDVGFLAGLGIPLILASAALGIGGIPLLRCFLLPLSFLALMVPPPRFIMYELLFRLKLVVTNTAVALMQASGQTVIAEGNQILVPGHTLFVADACSGLTSIVTLLPLSCIVAYFLSRGYWRRALVVASVVPLAMAVNILRVVTTVGMVSSIGIEAAQGSLHETFGVVTYIIGTLSVIGVARVLR
jgi:exosortase